MSARRVETAHALRECAWLGELRLRFELAVEILDVNYDYAFDALPESHTSAGLRAALNALGEAALREVFAAVVRTAKPKTFTVGDLRILVVLLTTRVRMATAPAGVLALAAPYPGRGRDIDSLDQIDRRLDSAGQWLAASVDVALSAAMRQNGDTRDLERMAQNFDVVDALTTMQSEQAIMALLMDALALWYDADVYVYRQDLSGAFTLFSTLPGADAARAAPQLLGHQVWGRSEVFSAESLGELDELGWSMAMGHTLFVPVVVDQSTEWLLALAEVRDDASVRQALNVFRRVAGALLSDLQHQAVDRLLRRLHAILLFSEAPFHATARVALEAVGAEADASSVQFTVFQMEDGQPTPTLTLQWGGAETDFAPFVEAETTSLSAGAIAVGLGAGPGITAVLSLKHGTGAFLPVAQRLARAAAAAIGVWLSGSLRAAAEVRVPEPDEYGVELMQRLRHQVDRFGHVRVGGAVAVVLPQRQPPAGAPIDEAVELIEHLVRPSDVIGAVGSSGAGVLLPDATRDVASAVVGRLLRAARDKGLHAARVGVAMFAAASESPESVVARALMNARRGSAV
jgi:hypothetical protein